MLGWHISVYRQAIDRSNPATPEADQGDRIAVWQTGIGGRDWLDELVTHGDAINLGEMDTPAGTPFERRT